MKQRDPLAQAQTSECASATSMLNFSEWELTDFDSPAWLRTMLPPLEG